MADLYLIRTVSGLAAADDAAREILRKVKVGKTVKCEISTPRNLAHHKKFFALLNTVWAATGDWASVDDLLFELKFNLGLTQEVVIRKTGEVVKMVRSISFAAMDQEAFDVFYESAIQELCFMAGGIQAEHLREEVLHQLAAA